MGLDAGLAAAVTLQRQHGLGGLRHCAAADAVFQLTLAHVLLDGGYDGVVTLGEVLPFGDHGLGTFDRLDGELVVVDGEPWRIDVTGAATLMPPSTSTPFVVLSTMESTRSIRLRDTPREQLSDIIDSLVEGSDSVVSVRLEGRFSRVLVRSVPAQTKPYRPYLEVCASDEVRFEYFDYDAVFIGFRFPVLDGGDTIAGLHLHGLDSARRTGGHNHELMIHDALLTVSTTRDIGLALPDRSMVDMLEMQPELREVQRLLLRRGSSTVTGIATALDATPADIAERLAWLADRGFVEELESGIAGLGGEPRWKVVMKVRGQRIPSRAAELLVDL
jgi:acetolactate decarboxylase